MAPRSKSHPIRQRLGWCSLIVLAPKPHQETITDIADFIWRLWLSYRGLNSGTKVNSGAGAGILFWISLEAKSGYHQITVRERDQENLAFFLPDNTKVTFVFGPMNAPARLLHSPHVHHPRSMIFPLSKIMPALSNAATAKSLTTSFSF
jgi:hypothetical protein